VTRRAAGFSLRVYSSTGIELQRARPCERLTFRGAWGPDSAGGARDSASFGSNPQFVLSASNGSNDACILLRRVPGDPAAAAEEEEKLAPARGEALDVGAEGAGHEGLGLGAGATEYSARGGALGVTLLRTADEARALAPREEHVAAEGGFDDAHRAALALRLPRDSPLLLVPSTSAPGVHAAYRSRPAPPRRPAAPPPRRPAGARPGGGAPTAGGAVLEGRLDVFSDARVEARRLPPVRRVLLRGAWRAGGAGGSHLHASWGANPQFHLFLPPPPAGGPAPPARVLATLRLADSDAARRRARRDPLGGMPGLYLLAPAPENGALGGALQGAAQRRVPLGPGERAARCLAETPFSPGAAAALEVELPRAGAPYVLVPATLEPGRAGAFSLELSSDAPLFAMQALDD